MSITFSVSLIGFKKKDQERLLKVFDFSTSRDRIYQLADVADIIIVNSDDEAALGEGKRAAKQGDIALVTVGRKAKEEPCHISPPLITSRVLRVLDQIDVKANDPISTSDSVSVVDGEERGYRALVVDDSLAMREALKQELSVLPLPLAIDFAEDGEKALEFIGGEHEYDLIFLDIVMPGIDGYDVCKKIRKDTRYKKTPIVMLSGKTSPLDEVKGIISGCNTYLTKPISHEEFQQVIHRVVKWLDNTAR